MRGRGTEKIWKTRKESLKENERKNKAGYTANTSRGRVGRGGNARFHTFHGSMDQWTDQRTHGQSLL